MPFDKPYVLVLGTNFCNLWNFHKGFIDRWRYFHTIESMTVDPDSKLSPRIQKPNKAAGRAVETLRAAMALLEESPVENVLPVEGLPPAIIQPAPPQPLEPAPEPAPPTVNPPPSSDVQAIARYLQTLTGRALPVNETEVARAADLLAEIVSSPNPAQRVADHLAEIDGLLPALIELNIRQALNDGREDLAAGLRALQTNVNFQLAMNGGVQGDVGGQVVTPLPNTRFAGKVLILEPEDHRSGSRISLVEEGLAAHGCTVSRTAENGIPHAGEFDVLIVCNPHQEPALLEKMAACAAAKIPVILDMDTDFDEMPVSHPEYKSNGLSSPENARAYMAALLLSSLVTVSNEALAEVVRAAGYKACTVPDGWSRQNPLWRRLPPRRRIINLGWLSTSGQLEDVLTMRRVLIRTLREFTQTQLVICGNAQVYQLFESVPENRRLFVPETDPEDYPYLLDQVDILLVPQRNIPYNRARSDRILMEAGVKATPWIASPMPSFKTWKEGGVFASSPDEWHTYLRQLIMDNDLRQSLGEAGREHAEQREVNQLAELWLDVIENVIKR